MTEEDAEMSWQQMNDDERQMHEEEIEDEDWRDYERWIDRDRSLWYYLRTWIERMTRWD